MEPKIPGYNQYYSEQTPEEKKSGLKTGCLGILGVIILIPVIAAVGYFFVYPALTPNSIKGELLDVTIVPDNEGGKMWVLMDGSHYYIQSVKTPGRTSMGRKCIMCKTWLYIVDPASGKILDKHKSDMDDIITVSDIDYANGKVWVFIKEYGENQSKIETYDAVSGKLISDTKAFIKEHKELSAGIAEINYNKKLKQLKIKTNDASDLTLDLETEKFYSSGELRNIKDSAITTVLVLASDNDSPKEKKSLYSVTGPKYKLKESSLDNYVQDPKSLKFRTNSTAEVLGGTYLEGIIYHQDKDCAIIIHLDRLGKQSNRIMSCIDVRTGKEIWRAEQEELFEEMKIDENKDSFSSLFFTKDKIEISRASDMVILELKGVGIMIFDYKSGKKIKEIKI
jgi:hypothetical protein